MMWKCWNF